MGTFQLCLLLGHKSGTPIGHPGGGSMLQVLYSVVVFMFCGASHYEEKVEYVRTIVFAKLQCVVLPI